MIVFYRRFRKAFKDVSKYMSSVKSISGSEGIGHEYEAYNCNFQLKAKEFGVYATSRRRVL